MPWVNIFEHEECEVVIGLVPYGNTYPPAPWAVFPLAKNPATPQIFEGSVGIYSIDAADDDTGARVIGVPWGVQHAPLSWGMYIIPSGGVAGRRFRARVLRHTSAFVEPPEDGFILCPGYFFDGCGSVPSYDEAAMVPFNPSGNPPEDSEWYEFEEVAAEPDAGGLDTTGWVGLFNYSYEDYSAAFPHGFFEWQVWSDGTGPAVCFWTDLVNATQECGSDVGGQWVPLHMAGIAYDLGVEDGEGSIAGSTVTIDTEHYAGSVWWLAIEGFDGEIRLRVTPLSFTATGGDYGGGIYTPAKLDVENDNDGYYQIGNQAPPYPDTNFPPFVPEQVGSWENSMLSDIRAEGYLYLNYHIGRCNGDGAPMHEQGQFLVEIWVD